MLFEDTALRGGTYSTNFVFLKLIHYCVIIIIVKDLFVAASASLVSFCLRVTMLRSTTPGCAIMIACNTATPVSPSTIAQACINYAPIASDTKTVPLLTDCDGVRIGVRGHCGRVPQIDRCTPDAHWDQR